MFLFFAVVDFVVALLVVTVVVGDALDVDSLAVIVTVVAAVVAAALEDAAASFVVVPAYVGHFAEEEGSLPFHSSSLLAAIHSGNWLFYLLRCCLLFP